MRSEATLSLGWWQTACVGKRARNGQRHGLRTRWMRDMVGGGRIGERRIGGFLTAFSDAGGLKGQAFGQMEWKQQEAPLGPEWRVAGLAARDTEEKIGIRAWGKITQCELWDRGSWSTFICAVGAGRVHLMQNPPPTKPADGNPLLARTTLSVGSG